LLYDLDLTDPALGLAPCFPGLSRLPLFNALQYNCCDMVYRVVTGDAIEILTMGKPEKTKWNPNFPFDNYPRAFPQTPIQVVPVAPELISWCISPLPPDGCISPQAPDGAAGILRDVLNDSCLFPRVGGRHLMWQSIPDWACPTPGCRYAGKRNDEGKEVFAVIWERPIPELHLWSDEPKYQDLGDVQIIFSRCTGCGVLHSCNRCT
jgi:hypothetical protein